MRSMVEGEHRDVLRLQARRAGQGPSTPRLRRAVPLPVPGRIGWNTQLP